MEIVYFNSPITKNIRYDSEIETRIYWNSNILNLILNNSIIQKIKYIISKVF
jgi:hypothetical protein